MSNDYKLNVINSNDYLGELVYKENVAVILYMLIIPVT